MTTPQLLEDLKRDEGLRLAAYPDPLSHGEPYTIGYGHTGGIEPHEEWSLQEAETQLATDVELAEHRLDFALTWWRKLDDVRQDAVANMAFNMGVTGLLGFHHFLAALQDGDYPTAAAQMLQSLWAHQVGDRAQRLAFMIRTGARPDAAPNGGAS